MTKAAWMAGAGLLAAAALAARADGVSALQRAIDAAPPGATIRVPPGIYAGPVRLAEGLLLVAADPDRTVIDGGGAEVAVTAAPGSAVVGFTIRNARIGFRTAGAVAGVYGCRLSNCTEAAVLVEGAPAVIAGNVIVGGGEGVRVRDAAPLVIENAIVSNRSGLRLEGGRVPGVTGNRIGFNASGLVVAPEARVWSAGNVFFGNERHVVGAPMGETDRVAPFDPGRLAPTSPEDPEACRDALQRLAQPPVPLLLPGGPAYGPSPET